MWNLKCGLWNYKVGLWNSESGLWNSGIRLWNWYCETLKTDCETRGTDCETCETLKTNCETLGDSGERLWNWYCDSLQRDGETLGGDCFTGTAKLCRQIRKLWNSKFHNQSLKSQDAASKFHNLTWKIITNLEAPSPVAAAVQHLFSIGYVRTHSHNFKTRRAKAFIALRSKTLAKKLFYWLFSFMIFFLNIYDF